MKTLALQLVALLAAPLLPAGITAALIDLNILQTPDLTAPPLGETATPLPDGHAWLIDLIDRPADTVLWIDARTRERFDDDRVPGAVWCSEDDYDTGLLNVLDAWDGDADLIVYCDGAACDASTAVAERLRIDLGLEIASDTDPAVLILHGGWDAWLDHTTP